MSTKLHPRSLLESLEERIKQNRWKRALKVEKIMRQVYNYNAADTAVYNAAIDAYQRAQNLEDMKKMFEEMKLEGFVPDAITYTI